MFGLDGGMTVLLLVCLLAACCFEFINGFHDTANAVATVIYTNSMKPLNAVIWSGLMNFIGVTVGGIAVAIGIINLLPISILVDQSVSHNVAMILSIILTAIIWNLGTWYFGIPCSSSHTLLGAIFGVGLAYGLLPDSVAVALNWDKVKDVGLALLFAPFFGFAFTMLLVMILKKYFKKSDIFDEPKKKKAPPVWIRSIIIGTSTLVSYTHGSNDGQKGVGLVMIILIGLIPMKFAINHNKSLDKLNQQVTYVESVFDQVNTIQLSAIDRASMTVIKEKIDTIQARTSGLTSFDQLKKNESFILRKNILIFSKEYTNLISPRFGEQSIVSFISNKDKRKMNAMVDDIKSYTEYSPFWVILMISISLGLGTMIGWKRITVTIGEKIGKDKLTYAQGASANIIAASTIWVSSLLGLPVSTTHVLSSGVAGSMVAKGGIKNLRMKTIRSILLAWLITLPVTIVLAGALFLLFRWLI